MKINFKKLWLNVIYSALLLLPASVAAQGLIPPPRPAGTAGGGLLENIKQIVDWFLALVAFVAVIMLIYGGIKYIISGGDESATSSAKNTILYAIVGLIVIGLSWVIVTFTIASFS